MELLRGARGVIGLRRAARLVSSLLAVLGTVCLLAIVVAWLGGYSLVMFSTGSMAPALPAGSLALTRTIPAADAEVGQVVTAVRDDGARVTHRVVATEPAGPGARSLSMQGDANDAADPEPYLVREVGLVVWSAPDLAYTVDRLQRPGIRLTITVVVATYVVGSLWPRRRQESGSNPSRRAVSNASSRP